MLPIGYTWPVGNNNPSGGNSNPLLEIFYNELLSSKVLTSIQESNVSWFLEYLSKLKLLDALAIW